MKTIIKQNFLGDNIIEGKNTEKENITLDLIELKLRKGTNTCVYHSAARMYCTKKLASASDLSRAHLVYHEKEEACTEKGRSALPRRIPQLSD